MIRTLITTILSFNTIQDLILYLTSEINLDFKKYRGFFYLSGTSSADNWPNLVLILKNFLLTDCKTHLVRILQTKMISTYIYNFQIFVVPT